MITNFREAIESMTPDTYQSLKRAVEIGKWPDGNTLTQQQRDISMQAVIAYEKAFLPEEQQTGYIPPREHTHCGSTQGDIADDEEKPINWKN